jgi:DNA-binding Lrp family transcriptional regulator
MQFPRHPRFERTANIAPLQLTERDREIIRLVHRHRFLRSSNILSSVGGSRQHVVRRLQLLFHHGYLERPRCQLDYYHQGGSREIVYGLADKGAALLIAEGVLVFPSRPSEKNRAVGRVQLEHSLMVAEVMLAIETVCRKNGTRFVPGDHIAFSAKKPALRWNVDIGGGRKLGIFPDRVFALIHTDAEGNTNQSLFCLEADRGTMPVVRKDLSSTSMYRKLLAYEATWSQGVHRTRFGFNRFRVLTVTTGAERVRSLVGACSLLKSGHGLFLFADRTILDRPEDILSARWHTGRPGETGTILE